MGPVLAALPDRAKKAQKAFPAPVSTSSGIIFWLHGSGVLQLVTGGVPWDSSCRVMTAGGKKWVIWPRTTQGRSSRLSPAQKNPPSAGTFPFPAATSPVPRAADMSWRVHVKAIRTEEPRFPKVQRRYKLEGADFQIPSAEQGENIPSYLPH